MQETSKISWKNSGFSCNILDLLISAHARAGTHTFSAPYSPTSLAKNTTYLATASGFRKVDRVQVFVLLLGREIVLESGQERGSDPARRSN